MSEIYNEIGELASERSKMICDQMNIIEKDLEEVGLKYGMEVYILDGINERKMIFHGVRCNAQYLIYLEFREIIYDDTYAHFDVLDINHDIKIILPQATIDYQTFMKNYQ